MQLVPSLSDSNQVLTEMDWQQLRVNTFSIDWAQLLMRPGIEVLNKLTNLTSLYPNLPKFLTLGHAHLDKVKLNADGWSFRSAINGSQIEVKLEEAKVFALEHGLTLVVTDKELAQAVQLEKTDFSPSAREKIYFSQLQINSFDELVLAIQTSKEASPTTEIYVAGNFSWSELQLLSQLDIDYLATNAPIMSAVTGTVYSHSESYEILDEQYQFALSPLDKACQCTTCQSFTRSYLHHLYQHTPLLAQNYLAYHNSAKLLATG